MKMTLEFEVHVYDRDGEKVEFPDLESFVRDEFHDWSDGRYSFSSEMVRNGIRQLAQNAVEKVIETAMYQKYGNEMVQVGEKHHTAKAIIQAKAVIDSISVSVSFPEYLQPLKVSV